LISKWVVTVKYMVCGGFLLLSFQFATMFIKYYILQKLHYTRHKLNTMLYADIFIMA
jgi:hypothetical protein